MADKGTYQRDPVKALAAEAARKAKLEAWMLEQEAATLEHFKALEGAHIERVSMETIYGVTYPMLHLDLKNRQRVRAYVQSDEEGNGGGWIEFEG